MNKRRGEVLFVIILVLFSFLISVNTISAAGKKYNIEPNQTLTLTFTQNSRSLFLIELDSSYTNLNYDFELRNSTDHIVTAKSNIDNQFTTGYVDWGEVRARIFNNNEKILVLKIKFEAYDLDLYNEINGYSYENEIFCWSYNTRDVSGFKQFPIQSLKNRDYFLTFIALEDIDQATLWLSFLNPQEYSDWSTYLSPMNFDRNQKVEIKLEKDTNWLVTSVTSTEDANVIIILQLRGLNILGKFFIGLFAATAGVSLFFFVYIDPLKYRKRKVDGESYDHQKQKYEQHEDLSSTLKEVLTSEKNEKE